MKIFLTNDDGYHATGLNFLNNSLSKHETLLIAPDKERSSCGHGITLGDPLRLTKKAENVYACSGLPADCVLVGIGHMMKDNKPDIVISGINHGANLGDDVLYSGTVGAAMGGRFSGIPCLASSVTNLKPNYMDTAIEVISEIVRNHIKNLKIQTVLNINVPDIPKEDVQGFAITQLGRRVMPDLSNGNIDAYGDEIHWIGPPPPAEDNQEGTDFNAIENNFVSITPLTTDLTDKTQIKSLQNWIAEFKG